MILGLDIGGANTKAASSDGSIAISVYLPLWKGAPLESLLKKLAREHHFGTLGVVMTGELADCFSEKMEGISHIMGAVNSAFDCPIYYWGINGFLRSNLRELAGANWSASAAFVAAEIGDCIFVDMGSTTTDLIPIKKRSLAAKTDFERLKRGELVYSGLLRTSVSSLLHEALIEGDLVPLSPELFAITADAYLALSEINADEYTCETPDGRGIDPLSAKRRLARTVCADLDEIGDSGAMAIARQVKAHQLKTLRSAIDRQAGAHGLEHVVAAGAGERLIAEAARSYRVTRISERYGQKISSVFPAYAVARLLELWSQGGEASVLPGTDK